MHRGEQMATLTTNLFWGQGETDHRLEVVHGSWPGDVDGSVIVVGPDKRRPGGHWFAEPGLLQRIRLRPDADGRIRVDHRLVRTPVARLRRRLSWLFHRIQFIEVSPFGVSNLANTGVQPMGDRLFVGYDAGRPVEVDPVTLDYLTPVGSTAEWLQGAPGLLEPLCAVAAHPAEPGDGRTLYFVNYAQMTAPGEVAETYVARWRDDGAVERWRVDGLSPFDSIHDVKVTEHHLVFSDLPFVVDSGTFRGAERTERNQLDGGLWMIPLAELDRVPPGGSVRATEARLPYPVGHLFVDRDEYDGCIRVVAQHMPLTDLMLTIDRSSRTHATGELIDPNYEGLIAMGVQPSLIGSHLVDTATGLVVESDLAHDDEHVWGGVLCATDTTHPSARSRPRQLWYSGVGYDPDLVSAEWWRLYGDATDGLVAPGALPEHVIPGSIARIDLESMKVAEVHTYGEGAFACPPTFVPRTGAAGPEDGYLVVVVHRDGAKAIEVFDAMRLSDGPLARASAPDFSPGLLLHSCWMPERAGPRPSTYRVPLWRDVAGALRRLPGVLLGLLRTGRKMAAAERSAKQRSASRR